ncbi:MULTISPECIES: restriction endonuclease subunit S [unclassified Xanthomonas]|uniref:restriction endonuclease subunit S n=1 Tax=Xanthomonas sp. LMG 9002 TaxID=1591158 RepID=UPI0013721814|nr:restriction endonuclease subunit S [Xanthomonas sp. LMG 9002]MXV05542.1 restriction endonuclease subunit S [Xanthomonas sp. LMG 9002]
MSDFNLVVDIPNAALWPLKSADSLCSVISRGTAPIYVEKSEVRAIGQRCVSAKGFIAEHARPHSEGAISGVLRPESGDVLLNSTGTGTIGRSAVFDSPGKFIVDGHVTVLRPLRDSADGRWLNSVLQTPHAQRHLERFCYVGSTNQLELSRTPLRLSQFPTPSLNEQEMIGSVVDTLDTAIHETEALIAKLKAVKQGLLHDLLTRGIDANGELRPPQSEAPHLYKPSPLGLIPNAWNVEPLSRYTASEITYGIVQAGPHIPGGVPYIRTGDMSGDSLIRETMLCTSRRIANSYMRSKVRAGEVVMAIRATVGRVLPVPDDLDGANLTQGTARISPSIDADGVFLLWALRHTRALKAINLEVKGTTFAEITLNALRRIPLAAPLELEEQIEIGRRLNAIDRSIMFECEILAKRRAQKFGLMNDLLTGRVRVTPLLDATTA